MYTEELRGLFSSPDTQGWSNKESEMDGACGIPGGEKSVQRFDEEIWLGRPLARPRRRWKNQS
jgi:hypothetical protein